ncbi:Peptidoglycan D,D-transpeptidase MrdA [bacterium HR17]|uniref:Peptidoglycan D,D-transpeptidase MrdA n=1 Tax=Candidatus Fervidibacter japonicus TaxID=2035412 RepID=A0A2H5XFU2_9BACT|nr:Peptidoglycan D,D-transpeptidase MrdA [bacterium HR17]
MTERQPVLPIRRLRVGYLFVVAMALVFCGRLGWLQIGQGEQWDEKARSRYLRAIVTKAPRGTILDRNGKVLATNEPSFSIALLPAEFSADGVNAQTVCRLVGTTPQELEAALAKIRANKVPLFEPVRLRVNADIATVTRVMEHNFALHGITVLEEPLRVYPHGTLAAHVLGHVGAVTEDELAERPDLQPFDWTGKMGVERVYDRYLQGDHGREVLEVDAMGAPIQRLRREHARAGQTLVLTLDAELQAVAERALQGKRGAVVALDPKTGEVLVMASSPTFDPNWFSAGIKPERWRWLVTHRAHPLQNRAIATTHPPGSTFKIVTAVAALLYGKVTPKTRIACGGGRVVGRRFFRCWRRHATLDLEHAIGQSCDSYFYTLGLAVGPERLAHVAHLMGLGTKTGIDVPGEAKGVIPTPAWKRHRYHERWFGGDTANMAIGQGYVAATPLQMALVACAVANDGVVMRPHLLKERRDAEGRLIARTAPQVLHRINAPLSLWATVKQGMLAAVYGSGGTAGRLRDLPLRVAGKTGSSEHRKGRKTHAWFIAFAPADDPRIALCVMVEEAGHGGEVAVPIAKEVLQAFARRVAQ